MSCTAVAYRRGEIVKCQLDHDKSSVAEGHHLANIEGGDVYVWQTSADLDDPMTTRTDPSKRRWSFLTPLLPALEEVVRAFEYGADKHHEKPGEVAWKLVQDAEQVFGEKAIRHGIAHAMGVKFDPESGRPHLALCIANLLIVLASQGEYIAP